MIEILSTGLPNSVQDLGRNGYLSLGVARSGAMDTYALQAANALVGNDCKLAGIELTLFPFKLRFHQETVFACTGADVLVRLDDQKMPSWWSRSACKGQTLVIESPVAGARAYLAFNGGIDVPEIMGSRSTDLKSGFGGLNGRGLQRGDMLPLGKNGTDLSKTNGLGLCPSERCVFREEVEAGCVTLRVLPAAQWHQFQESSLTSFLNTTYRITPQSNRQGYRLEGEALNLIDPLNLLSHGIVSGTIQVPPSGQPIIQLAEANTCGGYPKIATVIAADLWRLAQTPVGCQLRFEVADVEIATQALRSQVRSLSAMIEDLGLMAGRN